MATDKIRLKPIPLSRGTAAISFRRDGFVISSELARRMCIKGGDFVGLFLTENYPPDLYIAKVEKDTANSVAVRPRGNGSFIAYNRRIVSFVENFSCHALPTFHIGEKIESDLGTAYAVITRKSFRKTR